MKPKRFVLLGHPVRHSLSASMFGAAFQAAKLLHTYTPIDVPDAEDLGRMVREIRTGLLDGANVTLPHKQEVLKLIDDLDPSAEQVNAANVLMRADGGRIEGFNTDAQALEEEIAAVTTLRSRVVILGAGGGAYAAIAACKTLGFKVVGVTTRSWNSSEAMHEAESAHIARKLGALACPWPQGDRAVVSGKLSTAMRLQWSELAVQADLLIHATSAGVSDDDAETVASVVPWSRLPKHAVALDLAYRPRVTPFMAAARGMRLHAVSGLGMLVRQAEATYRIWFGAPPPEGVMRRAAEAALPPSA